jgi:hypothetical protein
MRIFSEPGDLPGRLQPSQHSRKGVQAASGLLPKVPLMPCFLFEEQKVSWGLLVFTPQNQITPLPVNAAFCVRDSAAIRD